MKTITLFGARGRTGVEVVAAARARGITVHPFDTRKPSDAQLREAVRNVDGVVIVFGPRPPYTDIFCAQRTADIVRAMVAEGVRRVICQTGAMIGDYRKNRSWFFEYLGQCYRTSHPEPYADRVGQEEAVQRSALEWTIVKPPRLTASRRDGAVTAGPDIKAGLLSSVSRRRLAAFIVGELVEPHHIHQAVFVKNR